MILTATIVLLVLNLLCVLLPPVKKQSRIFGRWINVVAVISLTFCLVSQLFPGSI